MKIAQITQKNHAVSFPEPSTLCAATIGIAQWLFGDRITSPLDIAEEKQQPAEQNHKRTKPEKISSCRNGRAIQNESP